MYEVKDGSVEFTDVSFSYAKRPDKTVLDDIDLIIPSGPVSYTHLSPAVFWILRHNYSVQTSDSGMVDYW